MSALGQKRTFDLFNNFVGDLVETQRHFEAKRLCGFDIYDHGELYGALDGKFAGFRSLEDLIGIVCCAPEIVDLLGSIGDETASLGPVGKRIDRRQPITSRERDNL